MLFDTGSSQDVDYCKYSFNVKHAIMILRYARIVQFVSETLGNARYLLHKNSLILLTISRSEGGLPGGGATHKGCRN